MSTINFKPTGFHYCYCSLEIMINESGDAAIYAVHGKPAQRWQEIKYNKKGEAYITIYNKRYYLNDFIKYPNL